MRLPAFVRAHYRTIGLVLLGCCVLIPLVRPRPNVEDHWRQYNASLIAAHTRERDREHDKRINAEHDLVIVKRDAARARVAYWAARTKAVRQDIQTVAASIAGDTITIQQTPYVVPHPVAIAWAQRDTLIAIQTLALTNADSAIVKTMGEVAATDSVASHAVKEADAATLLADDQKARADAVDPPRGFFARLRDGAQAVSRFALVAGLGYAAGKLLP